MFTKYTLFFFFFFFLVKQLSSGLLLFVIRKTFKFAVFYLYMNIKYPVARVVAPAKMLL